MAWRLPELAPYGPAVRLPELRDVHLTERVRRLIDRPELQRLRRVRQLGPTHLVYPGAMHTRFEHSLGCYGNVRRFIDSLQQHPGFRDAMTETDLSTVLLAGLLHDIGHYPFAHNLEALHRRGRDTPRHEDLAADLITGPLADALRTDFGVDAERLARLIRLKHDRQPTQVDRVLASIVSSALDADKMDYLERDSAHLGVPYGRSFDAGRLIAALTLSEAEDSVAITAKGKVPAEMFAFSRYMMFSEAYWHHTVRAAAAMIEAALADYVAQCAPTREELTGLLMRLSDGALLEHIRSKVAPGSVCARLLDGLTGDRRRLYKRVATYSRVYAEPEKRAAYERLYGATPEALDAVVARLGRALSRLTGREVAPGQVLVDTPPRDKDHPETVEVIYPEVRGRRSYPLHELSRVVAGVHTDFVQVVKKIRVFVAPEVAEALSARGHEAEEALLEAVLA